MVRELLLFQIAESNYNENDIIYIDIYISIYLYLHLSIYILSFYISLYLYQCGWFCNSIHFANSLCPTNQLHPKQGRECGGFNSPYDGFFRSLPVHSASYCPQMQLLRYSRSALVWVGWFAIFQPSFCLQYTSTSDQ